MSSQICDVAVIGGGPAGSVTALLLARRGYHVILFDREKTPRPKACGEYLTPGAVRLLRALGTVIPQMMAQGAMPITHETVTAHDGQTFGGDTDALASPRTVTDAALRDAARAAGAHIVENVSVNGLLSHNGAITGVRVRAKDGRSWECRARITVGADGTRSLVARTMGVVRPVGRLQHIALVGHFEYPTDSEEDTHTVSMHLPSDSRHACCGVGAPCGPNMSRNVNMVVPLSEAPRMAGRRDAYFAETLRRSFPRVWDSWKDAKQCGPLLSVPCFGHYTARASGDGALLVGDAATFIHPFTGEGVFFALRGAMLAAETISRALTDNDKSRHALSSYDRARRRELLPRYQLCDLVQRVVHAPALLAVAGHILRTSPRLTNVLLRTIGDLDRPRDLMSPPSLARTLWSPTHAY